MWSQLGALKVWWVQAESVGGWSHDLDPDVSSCAPVQQVPLWVWITGKTAGAALGLYEDIKKVNIMESSLGESVLLSVLFLIWSLTPSWGHKKFWPEPSWCFNQYLWLYSYVININCNKSPIYLNDSKYVFYSLFKACCVLCCLLEPH